MQHVHPRKHRKRECRGRAPPLGASTVGLREGELGENGRGGRDDQADLDAAEQGGNVGADFAPQVNGILTVGEFYEMAAGGEIVFT